MNRPTKSISNGTLSLVCIIAILLVDQIIKIAVKTNMCLGESILITDWFRIDFVENNGMAYGMTFFNKIALSLFRIFAVGLIGFYIYRLVQLHYRRGYILCLSMILAGAAGNILDSLFYGLIFSSSTVDTVAQLVPFGEGYASFLRGKVVDMFYFPIIETTWPEWVPFFGGNDFVFFSPVFNFADACISVGVVILILFFKHDIEGISDVLKARKQ